VTPSELRSILIAERAAWVRQMLMQLRALPLDSFSVFESDPRNPAAAESSLRRALEALLDLGRHVLSKGFGRVTAEYKEIAAGLRDVGVIDEANFTLLRAIAGYPNRMVHFYSAITDREIYQVCTEQLTHIETVLGAILQWVREHPERTDRSSAE
jgi:uncharacterized protein YutE (UPF0331/DUF86 family)